MGMIPEGADGKSHVISICLWRQRVNKKQLLKNRQTFTSQIPKNVL